MLVGIVGELLGVPLLGECAAVLVWLMIAARVSGTLTRALRNPALLLPGSFLVLIAISTVLLKLPASTPADRPIGWIDALFTATSGVCVTGLVVRDTASGFTPLGQGIIAGSIQLGGLGFMIFGTMLTLLFGQRLSEREHTTLSNALAEYPRRHIARFIGFIVLTTLVIEAVGAGVLFALWPEDLASGPGDRAFKAVFHSISAFCNAGFDITGGSMVPLRSTVVPYLGIMPLIVLGGLGFVVLEDLARRFGPAGLLGDGRASSGRAMRRRLSTHTKLVLSTTALLVSVGAALAFLMQLGSGDAPLWQRALDALFLSITSRTAGFNAMPMEELSSGSRFGVMLLMFIGGSPGSTAGGMKTVVFALLVLAVVATVRGRDEVEVFKRAIPDTLVKRAATIAVGMATLIAGATLALGVTERIEFEMLLFEVVSASTTTGLSLGATGELSDAGRLIVSGVMFLGRLGPLAAVAALIATHQPKARYRYATDSVSLG